MTAVRHLHLYGSLAERYGAKHPIGVPSLPEAIRVVNCNHPGFLHEVRRQSFHCLLGSELETADELAEHQVGLPRASGDFHLVPVAEGAKGRTGKMILSIVVGGALLATGIGGAAVLGGSGLFVAGTSVGLTYGSIALLGGAFLLGGLSQLLTPSPKVNSGQNEVTSFTFSGPAQTDDEGGPIPLIYGEVVTSGITIASSLLDGYGSTTQENPKGAGGGGTGGITTGGGFREYSEVMVAY